MSQEINNREYRQQVILDLLRQLHEGKHVDEVKAQFEAAFSGVSAKEISDAEQALIEGGLPVEEVQRLCDVHAAVFSGSIEDVHKKDDPALSAGHPIHTLMAENRAIEALIDNDLMPALGAALAGAADGRSALAEALKSLSAIGAHYSRKENLLFPYLEKKGITAPPKVMWGVDDEIRSLIKTALTHASAPDGDDAALKAKVDEAATKVKDMIFKEENILIPMLLDNLSDEQWQSVAAESDELGYCLIDAPPGYRASLNPAVHGVAHGQAGDILFPTGALNIGELTGLLNTLPIDITFVDKDGVVKYFSQGAERIFPRTKAVIGRSVSNCHPPASVHIVEGIVEDLKSGKKDEESFWIKMHGAYVYIRYFAVRDEGGAFLGTLEVTQNIAPIQAIEGEKRLVSP